MTKTLKLAEQAFPKRTEKLDMNDALIKFWKILTYEFQKQSMDAADAYEFAMNDITYEPIDTRFCIQHTLEAGYVLMEASGTAIIRCIEGGDLRGSKE